MELLVLSTWFPYPPDNGSRLRAFHLLRELSKRHRIRLIAGQQSDVSLPEGIPLPLQELCASVTVVSWHWYDNQRQSGSLRAALSPVPRSVLETPNPAMTAAIADALTLPTDAVLVLELGMDAYLPQLPPHLPIVLEGIEASGMYGGRLRQSLTQVKARRYWTRRLRRYTALTTVSETEAHAARRLLPGKVPVEIVPNGVDWEAYTPSDPGMRVPGRLIYNGSVTYGPNREAVQWFTRDILLGVVAEVPEAHLVVTGRSNAEDRSESAPITFTGFLPDLRPALAEATLCVVPLRAGGGTRLKILEAWAAGLPVVSTTIGAAGLGAKHGEHLLLADDAASFTRAVSDLLKNPARAQELAQNARQLVETTFGWNTVTERLNTVLQQAYERSR